MLTFPLSQVVPCIAPRCLAKQVLLVGLTLQYNFVHIEFESD